MKANELRINNTDNKLDDIKLEMIITSSFCKYSVIEYKLAALYRNQEKILQAIKLLALTGKEKDIKD
jgi:tyrosine-protein phosphatase YwqE